MGRQWLRPGAMIVDVHTHNPEACDAIINASFSSFQPKQGKVYSVGVHPWDTVADVDLVLLDEVAGKAEVVAIGECGFDLLRGGDIDTQTRIFRHHVRLAEQLGKPLIIHCVKAFDRLLAERKMAVSSVPWIVHGFRGNAATAAQLTGKGIYLAIGEKFNIEAVRAVPIEMLLVETDTSQVKIDAVIEAVARTRGVEEKHIRETVTSTAGKLVKI